MKLEELNLTGDGTFDLFEGDLPSGFHQTTEWCHAIAKACKGMQMHAKACKCHGKAWEGKAMRHVYGGNDSKKNAISLVVFFLPVNKVRSRPRSTRCTSVVGRWHLYILYKLLTRWVVVMCAVIEMWSGGRGLPDTIVLIGFNVWMIDFRMRKFHVASFSAKKRHLPPHCENFL